MCICSPGVVTACAGSAIGAMARERGGAELENPRHGRGSVDSKRWVGLSPDLSQLSHAEKDALIQALTGQLAALQALISTQDARIAALEARLDALSRPAKTPDNSSKPPSQGQKQDRPPIDRPARESRPGVGRTLHPNPHGVVPAFGARRRVPRGPQPAALRMWSAEYGNGPPHCAQPVAGSQGSPQPKPAEPEPIGVV
jgi:Tfp pilus assembly protein FimV